MEVENKEEGSKNISKILYHYDEEVSNLDTEFANARLNIISNIQKYILQLTELEIVYKSEKMKITEKRNKNIKNATKAKKNKEKEKEKEKTVNQIYV